MAQFEDLRMGSESRLWELIEQRIQTGADVEAIDRQIWELFGEQWAVVFTDLAGFSRTTQRFGILHFLQVIYEAKRLLFPIVSAHGGFLVKSEGDSSILLFRSAPTAIKCAIAMQRACHQENARRVEEEQILLCLGVGFGRMLRIGEHDVWGQEVNAASKLGEDVAVSYEILVTDAVRGLCADVPELAFDELHEHIPGSARNFKLGYRLT